jgi:hypothetical protein
VRCFKIDRCGAIMVERRLPACDANAPAIARFKSGKSPFRMWRNQIVAIEHREIEEIARGLNANGVQPDVFGTGTAITVTIKSGHRIAATTFQFCSENIREHDALCVEELKRSSGLQGAAISRSPFLNRRLGSRRSLISFNTSTDHGLGTIRFGRNGRFADVLLQCLFDRAPGEHGALNPLRKFAHTGH